METKVNDAPFDRVFRWKNSERRAELYGRPCRILAKGSTMNSVLVEFEDGEKVITSARAVRLMDKRDEAHFAQGALDV